MTPEGEFRAGLEEAVAQAIYESVFVGSWDGAHGIERAQWLQAAEAAVDEALAFRLPDQPEGPRVAVVGEQVGWAANVWRRGWTFTRYDDGDEDRPSIRESWEPVFTLFPATPETP